MVHQLVVAGRRNGTICRWWSRVGHGVLIGIENKHQPMHIYDYQWTGLVTIFDEPWFTMVLGGHLMTSTGLHIMIWYYWLANGDLYWPCFQSSFYVSSMLKPKCVPICSDHPWVILLLASSCIIHLPVNSSLVILGTWYPLRVDESMVTLPRRYHDWPKSQSCFRISCVSCRCFKVFSNRLLEDQGVWDAQVTNIGAQS